jgi:hypothetical protein
MSGIPDIGRGDLLQKQRPGVNGKDFIKTGTRGHPVRLRFQTGLVSAAARAALQADLSTMIGDGITITDKDGINYLNQIVLTGPIDERMPNFAVATSTGGFGRFWYEFTLIVEEFIT